MSQREVYVRSYKIGEAVFFAPDLEGGLYLVATPIGNLRDVTLRSLEVLAGCDIIACEDTRVTRVLLDAYAIKNKTFAYHEHNSAQAGEVLLQALQAGKSVALVSDAGTPLISDPGFDLVRQAHALDIKIVPLPGASALLAGLVAAGLPATSFLFDGFLPTKSTARRARLKQLCPLEQTLIFYESPHRIAKTLMDMMDILGADRPACLCRELTKYYETIDTGTLSSLAQKYGSDVRIRGEIVLLISGACHTESLDFTQEAIDDLLMQAALTLSAARAAKEVASLTGEKRDLLYQRLLTLKQAEQDNGE